VVNFIRRDYLDLLRLLGCRTHVRLYASDLLAVLTLLAAAFKWRRAPERAAWMCVLAAMALIAIALLHPAGFIAGGPDVLPRRSCCAVAPGPEGDRADLLGTFWVGARGRGAEALPMR
jgi:hypothetical protein